RRLGARRRGDPPAAPAQPARGGRCAPRRAPPRHRRHRSRAAGADAGRRRRGARDRRRDRGRRRPSPQHRSHEDGAPRHCPARRRRAPRRRRRRAGASRSGARPRDRRGRTRGIRPPLGDTMDQYSLTDEERELAGLVRSFADDVVAPQAYEADRTKTLPLDVVAQMGELGLFGLPFPEEVGGQGGDYFALCLAIEALGRVDQSIAITLEAGVSLGAMPVFRFGTAAQQAELLPDLLAGRALAGFGLTEPEAGSDAGATRTTARLDGDEWVINGAKQFITNSGTAIKIGRAHV